MSLESSEIVTSLTAAIKSGLTELHAQNINDIQAIVSSMEVRFMAELIEIKSRLMALEAEKIVREVNQ